MKNDVSDKRGMYDILKAPDRLKHEIKGGAKGMLAYLWRQILQERNIGLSSFDALVSQYCRKGRRGQNSARVLNYFSKSAIYRELANNQMTIRVLIKGLQILDILAIDFSITLRGRYTATTHRASFNLSTEELYQPEEEAGEYNNAMDHRSPKAPDAAAAATSAVPTDSAEQPKSQ